MGADNDYLFGICISCQFADYVVRCARLLTISFHRQCARSRLRGENTQAFLIRNINGRHRAVFLLRFRTYPAAARFYKQAPAYLNYGGRPGVHHLLIIVTHIRAEQCDDFSFDRGIGNGLFDGFFDDKIARYAFIGGRRTKRKRDARHFS